MFRPFRLLFLLGLAFVAGVLFERANKRDLCQELGGTWNSAGLCTRPAQ
ncbi:hypothetical protein [Ponticoccus alexandrii]|nr:hypothetical protein [Ponticoccus alexandrii]